MTTLADRVKTRRIALGLTQGKVAKLAGLKQPDISKIELGLIAETTKMIGLSRALQCDPNWLAYGTSAKAPPAEGASHTPESSVQYLPPKEVDPLTTDLLTLFSDLDTPAKKDLLIYIRGFVAGRRPHSDGSTSAMAG